MCHVDIQYRLPSLTTVIIPEGVDGTQVMKFLLDKFSLEIGGGLGELKGKVWRIGLMGFNSNTQVVSTVLSCLQEALEAQGWKKEFKAK